MLATDKADFKLSAASKDAPWHMAKGNGVAQPPGQYPSTKVDYGKDGLLTFKILNPPGVTFAATDAFTPKVGKVSPKDFHDQFAVVSGEGTNTLVVKDANANKDGSPYAGGDYHYELHFSEGKSLDPIITNGGCCGAPSQFNMTYLALGVVAVAAILLLIIRLRRRSAPVTTGPVTKDIDQG